MGKDSIAALVQESLNVAMEMTSTDCTKTMVDIAVQPKTVMFSTDAKLLDRACEKLARLAQQQGVRLRQPYARISNYGLIALKHHTRVQMPLNKMTPVRADRCVRPYLEPPAKSARVALQI